MPLELMNEIVRNESKDVNLKCDNDVANMDYNNSSSRLILIALLLRTKFYGSFDSMCFDEGIASDAKLCVRPCNEQTSLSCYNFHVLKKRFLVGS